jgi:ABC-type phosphate transport system substrate-binding protein
MRRLSRAGATVAAVAALAVAAGCGGSDDSQSGSQTTSASTTPAPTGSGPIIGLPRGNGEAYGGAPGDVREPGGVRDRAAGSTTGSAGVYGGGEVP